MSVRGRLRNKISMSESGSNQSSGKPVSHTEDPSSGKSPSSGSNMSAGFNSTIRQVAGGVPLTYDTRLIRNCQGKQC